MSNDLLATLQKEQY